MRYYLIAGERSGDLHASNLMKALQNIDSEAQFRFFGGEHMQATGGTLVRHYREMAVMGFWEVLKNLPKIAALLKFCKKDILAYQPDAVILVDFAGFNMQIAKFCKQNRIKNFYYISPKIWAWNTKRAWKIKQNVDRMFVIFPFEKDFYKQFDYEVDFVGNPLLDAIQNFQKDDNFFEKNALSTQKPIIALLPGSRRAEVENMLSLMLQIKPHFPHFQWIVAGVDNLPKNLYRVCQEADVPVLFNQTYDLLANAHSAVVTSGTATLETALFGVPQVVCYKTSYISYQIAKRLIKVPFISLVNLIMNKKVVTELIQNDLNEQNLKAELLKIVEGQERKQIMEDYQLLKEKMGTAGASEVAAEKMFAYLNKPL
ncbi:MAG: lipid-A-disaccharide synthase [Raineya sp.]